MKIRHHHLGRRLLLLAAGLLLTAWLVPPYFHAGRYRRVLEAGLENKLGRPVELGAVRFRLLAHPGFSIDDVVIKEDPRFGSEPFARVDRVECDLRWRSLWGSRLDCARILLEHPVLNMVRNGQGKWNVQDFFLRSSTASRIRSPRAGARSPAGFDLDVEEARLNFTVGITKRPFTITGLSGGLTLDPYSGSIRFDFEGTPFRADLPQPAPGTVELSGEWKPGKDFRGPLRATLHTSDSLLYGWIPLLTGRNPEMYGMVNATIQISGSGDRLAMAGDIRLDQVHRWDSLPPLSSMPVGISFEGSLNRTRRRFFIRQADVSFADSRLHLTGAIDRIGASPALDLVLAVQTSELRDLLGLGARLSGREAGLDASGRVDGLLTIRGPWRNRRYGGFVAVHSVQLQDRDLSISIAQASVRIDRYGARLLPVRFLLAPHIECVAEGGFYPALSFNRAGRVSKPHTADSALFPPGSRPERFRHVSATLSKVSAGPKPRRRTPGHSVSPLSSGDRYEMTISAQEAPLRELLHLARSLRILNANDIDAVGYADATLRFSGHAWPFGKLGVSADADLHQARLLIPGLTEPVRLTRFHLEATGRDVRVDPLVVGMGPVSFSGWLKHEGGRANPWKFDAHASRLSMEQAALWFAVLGYRKPMPVLDLIPGLRSLFARRAAGRNIFASVNARGRFESPLVTFRSTRLKDLRANLAISGRVATIGNVAFRIAGGAGGGSARIDFKRVPALITGKFQLNGGELARIAWRLPPALRGIRGRMFGAGHFETRGLTRQEMSAGFLGEAGLRLTDVSLGAFDPLQALARAASLGSFQADPGAARLRSIALNLQIHGQRVILAPLQLKLGGAAFDINGNCGFNGKADVYVRADFRGVRRRWVTVTSTAAPAGESAPELALSAPPGEDTLATALLGHDSPPQLKELGPLAQRRRPSGGSKIRVAAVHLTGPVNALAAINDAAIVTPYRSAAPRQIRW